MNRHRAAYIAMGGALAVISAVSVGFAMAAAPEPVAVPEPEPVIEAPAPPTANPIPADAVIQGAPTAITDALKKSDPAGEPSARPIRVCDQDVDGWVRSETARAATKTSGVTVQVGAWRAGAAASTYRDLAKAAQSCGQVYTSDGLDQFRTASYSNDGQWAIGVRRFGDVLVVASASTLNGDPDSVLNTVMREAKAEMSNRLAPVCSDPGSTSDKGLLIRDPYSSDYEGYEREAKIAIAAVPVFTKKEINTIAAPQPRATWRGGASSAPYPQWAPLVLPPPGTPMSADPSSAPRGAAPLVSDPGSIAAPSSSIPSGGVGDEPELPTDDTKNSVAVVPAVDEVGPGCGWAFTSTVSPIVSEDEIQTGARQAILDQLKKDTRKQGEALVETIAWPQQRASWVRAASIQADWNAYYSAVSAARAQTAAAKAAYDSSVAAWQATAAAGNPPPAPAPAVP